MKISHGLTQGIAGGGSGRGAEGAVLFWVAIIAAALAIVVIVTGTSIGSERGSGHRPLATAAIAAPETVPYLASLHRNAATDVEPQPPTF